MAPSQQRSDIPSGAVTTTNNNNDGGGTSTPSSLTSAGVAIAGFLAGTAITATISFIIISSQRQRRHDRQQQQQQQQHKSETETGNNTTTTTSSVTQSRGIPPSAPSDTYPPPSKQQTKKKTLPPELRTEQLSRNTLYFGPHGMSSITSASVAVIGLGGVGSHAAHMLARSGIHYLRLVDFDQVTLSSLNRHACATLDDVGTAKAVCLKKFLERICPDGRYMKVDARVQMYTGDPDKDGTLLDLNGEKKWDVIVDCIDDVPTKAALLSYCVRNNIRCVSCMGAGGKADVTRLHISDLRSASRDPLASKLRQSLKRLMKKTKSGYDTADEGYLDDVDRIAVIYSSEKTVVKLAEFTEEQKEDGVHNFGAVDGMRIRVLPVLGTMPAIMGQSLASLVLCEIGGKMFSPVAGERVGRNVRHRMFQHLKRREKKIRDELETKEQQQQQQRRTTDTTTTKDDSGTTVVVPAAPSATTTTLTASKTSTNDGSNSGTTTTTSSSSTTKSSSNNPNDDTRKPRILSNGTWVGPVQIDSDDVEYLLTEVWRNRCAVTGDRLGTVLELVRWDMTLPSTCSNLVLLGARALEKFDDGNGKGRDGVKEEVRRKIEQRLKNCRVDANA